MKTILAAAAIFTVALPMLALDGQVGIHDPSSVIECEGKYYAFGTGGGGIMSDDGWTWRGGAVRPGGGVAPDVIHIGDKYIVAYGGGGGIHTMWTKTLDPTNCNFQDDTLIAPGDLDCNPIDPALLLDPTSGKLWLTYGSYVGYIRLMELDPNTGKRLDTNVPPANVAINCEASEMIYHDGWYYLLATHGSCCQGSSSGYHIIVGRSRKVAGPFIDNMGIDMLQGGGKLFCGSQGRHIGPGHFGLVAPGDDAAPKFSCHYEADLDRGGASVLDIRPVLWQDGWPVAGENLHEGTYSIGSVRTGTALELAVEGVPVGGGRRGGRGGAGGRRGGPPANADTNALGGTNAAAAALAILGAPTVPGAPGAFGGTNAPGGRAGRGGGGRGGFGGFGGQGGVIPPQDVAQVSTNWPDGTIDTRLNNYMCEAQQKWTISAVTNAGGYPGSPYFKITIAGTDRALAATEDAELTTVPAFSGAPEQLWRIEELSDSTWRIMPKSVPNSQASLALSAIGGKFATLAAFDPKSDRQRWQLNAP